jgi:hypothetical protein
MNRLVWAVAVSAAAAAPLTAAEGRKPNVIVILADDKYQLTIRRPQKLE